MKMNLPNKLTIFRIFLTFVIIFILLFPFYNLNINFPKYTVDGTILIDSKYFIAGIMVIIGLVN